MEGGKGALITGLREIIKMGEQQETSVNCPPLQRRERTPRERGAP